MGYATQCAWFDIFCGFQRADVYVDTVSRFKDMVDEGGPWDHKTILLEELDLLGGPGDRDDDVYFPIRGNDQYEPRYDVWSNIHYGYVGRAAGLEPALLQAGQFLAGRTDTGDLISVQIGIDLWERHGLGLQPRYIHQAILDAFPAFETWGAESGVLVRREDGNWR